MAKGFFLSLHSVTNNFGNKIAEVAQLVERQPSKLNVAGSTPVFRSKKNHTARCDFFASCRLSSAVECFLGKEEVTGSSPVVGSQHHPEIVRDFFCFKFKFFLSSMKTYRAGFV